MARIIVAHVCLLGAGVLLMVSRASALAAPYEFANFNLVDAGQPFSFTNNGGTSATISVSNAAVTFDFTSQSGLPTNDRAAFLNIAPVAAPSTFTPVTSPGLVLDQPIPNLERLTISSGVNGTGIDYLTLFFTGDVIGLSGSNSGILLGSDNNPNALRIVSFTSDFGTFSAPGSSYNLGLATITPPMSIGPGGFLNTFTANINGQFTANFTATVPEPSTWALIAGGVLTLVGIQRVRGNHK